MAERPTARPTRVALEAQNSEQTCQKRHRKAQGILQHCHHARVRRYHAKWFYFDPNVRRLGSGTFLSLWLLR